MDMAILLLKSPAVEEDGVGLLKTARVVQLAVAAEKELADYRATKQAHLLDSAIARIERLVEPDLTPVGEPARAGRYFHLADALRMRYMARKEPRDLAEALRHVEIAIAVPAVTQQVRVGAPVLHAMILFLVADATDALVDIEAALDAFDVARGAVPDHGFPEREYCLTIADLHSAPLLAARFRHAGDVADLKKAYQLGTAALKGQYAEENERTAAMNNLALVLAEMAELRSDLSLAEQAVELVQQVLDLPGTEGRSRLSVLGNLAQFHGLCYELSGDPAHLASAENAASSATVKDMTGDLPDELVRLNQLATVRLRRYQQNSSLEELESAQALYNLVVRHPATPESDRQRALTNLAWALRTRYRVTRDIDVLENALLLVSYAISRAEQEEPDDIDPDNPSFRWTLNQLGVLLRLRFEATGEMADLDAAEGAIRRAMAGSDHDPVERGGHALNLASVLTTRTASGLPPHEHRAVLNEAITLMRTALASGAGGADQAGARQNLADALVERHTLTGDAAALTEALELYENVATSTTATPRQRVFAARAVGRSAVDDSRAIQAYRLAISVLREALHPAIERAAREAVLHEHQGLAVEAASRAIAAGDPLTALELLEQGRSVLWSQSLRFTADLARLRVEHADLAAALVEVHDHLERLAPTGPVELWGRDTRAGLRRSLSVRRASLLDEIRRRPGFESFHRLPDGTALAGAGSRGPVLVLVAGRERCDVLVIDTAGMCSARLPTTRDELDEQAVRMLETIEDIHAEDTSRAESRQRLVTQLSWLYDAVAGPALDAAGVPGASSPDTAPRVWWCPTGILGLLPLHLAGTHTARGRAVLDRVVSSYTPTVRDLLDGDGVPAEASWDDLLVVNPPTPPKMDELRGADKETEYLVGRFPHARALVGERATAQGALDVLGSVSWAHFTCHGAQDLHEPSRAGLMLADRTLSFGEIASTATRPGATAVFSACDTARGGLRVLDEAVTLVDAARFAGFDHVIGALFVANDTLTAEVLLRFYELLGEERPSGDRIARALHAAVLAVRPRFFRAPDAFGCLVHTGR